MTSRSLGFPFLASLLPLLLLAVDVASVRAEEGPGTRAVRVANEKIRDLLRRKVEPNSAEEKKLAEQARYELRDFLDIDELGRRALADHWSEKEDSPSRKKAKGTASSRVISPEKRDEFLALLRELIEKNYIKGLRANLEYKVEYAGEQRKGEALLVNTVINTQRHGRPYKVSIDYELRQQAGKWRAYDVITDNVGLVENYRAQFNKLIERDGFDGLLDRMRKKRDKL
jgi:ABC-type transporter MlaC component